MLSTKLALCFLVICIGLEAADASSKSMLAQKLRHKMRSRAKHDDDTALDGGLNMAPLWEPDMKVTENHQHDAALMEDHAKMLKHAQKKHKRVSWLPFGDWRLKMVDLVPKLDPMKPEAASEVEATPQSFAELGLSLTHDEKRALEDGNINKQFVYPRLDADSTIFSGGNPDDPVNLYLKNGGFRLTVGAKQLVANRAVVAVANEECAGRTVTYSDHYCPNFRFPESVPNDSWRPFPGTGKDSRGVFFQYVGPSAADALFDPDNHSKDMRAKHFLGGFLFKKEGEKHLEWRCQDNGFNFLALRNLHFHLGVVGHHKMAKAGAHQHKSELAKAPKSLVKKIHASLGDVGDDTLSMMHSAKKVSYVYPKASSEASCDRKSHTADKCFEKAGGFNFITAGGEDLKLSMTPVEDPEALEAMADAPLRFNSHACPGVRKSVLLADCAWQPAPFKFAGKGVDFIWLSAQDAKKTGVFGSCGDKKAKKFGGAFVFRKNKSAEPYAWRCLDNETGKTSHSDHFRNAEGGNQSIVSNMVGDMSELQTSVDNSAGMVEESVDVVSNGNNVMTIPEKEPDMMHQMMGMYPDMKIE